MFPRLRSILLFMLHPFFTLPKYQEEQCDQGQNKNTGPQEDVAVVAGFGNPLACAAADALTVLELMAQLAALVGPGVGFAASVVTRGGFGAVLFAGGIVVGFVLGEAVSGCRFCFSIGMTVIPLTGEGSDAILITGGLDGYGALVPVVSQGFAHRNSLFSGMLLTVITLNIVSSGFGTGGIGGLYIRCLVGETVTTGSCGTCIFQCPISGKPFSGWRGIYSVWKNHDE